MPTTAVGAPYPALADPPNGPAQIQALAAWVDDKCIPRFANTAERDQKIQAPVAGQTCFINEANRLQIYATGTWLDIFVPLSNTKAVVYQPNVNIFTAEQWVLINSALRIDAVVPFSGALKITMNAVVAAVGGNPGRNLHISFRIHDTGTGTQIFAPEYYKGAQKQGMFVNTGQHSIERTYIQHGLTPGNAVTVSLMGRVDSVDSGDDGGRFLDSSLIVEPFNGTVNVTVI